MEFRFCETMLQMLRVWGSCDCTSNTEAVTHTWLCPSPASKSAPWRKHLCSHFRRVYWTLKTPGDDRALRICTSHSRSPCSLLDRKHDGSEQPKPAEMKIAISWGHWLSNANHIAYDWLPGNPRNGFVMHAVDVCISNPHALQLCSSCWISILHTTVLRLGVRGGNRGWESLLVGTTCKLQWKLEMDPPLV